MDRIAIFIDGSNLYYSQQKLNLHIDFLRLLDYFTSDGSLLRSFYYTGVDPDDKGQRGFIHMLRLNGYKVIEKPIKRYPDGSTKANLDIELAIDMLALADKYDRAVLFSGDGDLTRLVEAVQMKGVRVHVVSTIGMVATELRASADYFLDLSDIRKQIEKRGNGHGGSGQRKDQAVAESDRAESGGGGEKNRPSQ